MQPASIFSQGPLYDDDLINDEVWSTVYQEMKMPVADPASAWRWLVRQQAEEEAR